MTSQVYHPLLPINSPIISMHLLPYSTNNHTSHVLFSSSFKKLIDREMQIKRKRSLCFRCDEQFSPGHRYNQKRCKVLWIRDNEEDSEEVVATKEKILREKDLTAIHETTMLCVSFVVGFYSPHSMKVRGKIDSRELSSSSIPRLPTISS